MFNALHLCSRCAIREDCRLGLAVESGSLDEYMDEMIVREEIDPDWTDYEVRVIVSACERFREM